MKAIVLTCDKYHPFADHMIHCYMHLWPDNPFTFLVPYQNYPARLKEKYGEKIQLVQSNSDIKSTMETLLRYTEDEEWIYWCMDDRYPIELNVLKILDIYKWIRQETSCIDGLSFTLSAKDYSLKFSYIFTKSIRGPYNIKFFKKKHYGSIWSHQFIKTKALNSFFKSLPPIIKNAKEMDDYLLKDSILPSEYNLHVSSKSFAKFGESTSRGKITKNCYNSMINNDLSPPENFELTGYRIINNIDERIKYRSIWRLKDIVKNYNNIF